MTADILKRAAEAVEGTTPGPWVHKPIKGYAIDQIGHEEFCVCDVSYTSANIAEVGEYCETAKNRAKRPGEIEANARFIGAARTIIPDMAAAIAERDAEIERLTADLALSEAAKSAHKSRGDNHWETMRCIYRIATAEGDIQAIIQHIKDAGSGYTERPEETLRRYQTDLASMTARAEAAEAMADRLAEAMNDIRDYATILASDGQHRVLREVLAAHAAMKEGR